jgi:hypothetical protein
MMMTMLCFKVVLRNTGSCGSECARRTVLSTTVAGDGDGRRQATPSPGVAVALAKGPESGERAGLRFTQKQ